MADSGSEQLLPNQTVSGWIPALTTPTLMLTAVMSLGKTFSPLPTFPLMNERVVLTDQASAIIITLARMQHGLY